MDEVGGILDVEMQLSHKQQTLFDFEVSERVNCE